MLCLPAPAPLLSLAAPSARPDSAPSLRFVLQALEVYSTIDPNSLDPDDAIDFARELQWLKSWLFWYSKH
jgi:hypothetical protein